MKAEIKDRVRSYILSKCVNKDSRLIGAEIENIIHNDNNTRLPVNKGNHFSAFDLLKCMKERNLQNGVYSLEPGGQLEWSSPPYADLNELAFALEHHYKLLDQVTKENGLKIIHYALEPIYHPEKIELINDLKYQLMDKNMEKKGTMGKWMMRNTASIQVNFDILNPKDLEEMTFIADCLHPVAAYLFANSPFKENTSMNKKNIRNEIWSRTDNGRCGNLIDHGINQSKGLVNSYVEFVSNVQNIFELDRSGAITSSKGVIGQRLKRLQDQNQLFEKDIKAALHQIFTNVRLKNLVEVRGADLTPRGFEMAPIAFWTGLLTVISIRDEVLKTISRWTKKDRVLFNKSSFLLEFDQPGPQGKSYGEWISWASELALEGLKKRNQKEEMFFASFYDLVINKGPFAIQAQKNASKYCT